MYIQSRRRKLVSPFFSFLSNSFLLFSLHFPLNLNCQSNCKRKKPTPSEDPNTGASTSSTAPHGGDYEGREEQRKGNNYEVFLSFRGKDTRKGFTDHLYTGLVDAGIHVFRDDNELHVGEEIGPQLLCSITQSKILIPIISKDYASSKWCLCELVHMLKCRRSGRQIVLPIFYKVEPSQVRHLTGGFGDAINAHKENSAKKVVKEWEEALKEVSSLKGWESEKIDNGQEVALVKIVVTKVMSELKRTFQLIVPQQLVGIDDRIEDIMSLIDDKFNDAKIIGLYGMGGIGKTTLAKVLYNKLSSHFEYRSFVASIREKSQRKGIEYVQNKLISDIIGSFCHVYDVDEGIGVIKSRFTSKKVLILLDDMNDNTHFNALVGDGNWFGAGSIVIITTRDKSILDEARVGYVYPLNELSVDQSLILFSRHAFLKDSPSSAYEVISRDVVSTTGGLPLALEVIGSSLYGKRGEVWKDTLNKLKKVPHKEVQEKLRISYEALDHEQKQIFLDIACFLIGSSKRSPTYMWNACDFFPENGIEVLSFLSLIKIDKDGKLMMHDQLRDLGREIVRLENIKEPQERSRLWIYEEALDVLDSNKGTSKIEGLCLDKIGRSYIAEQFKKMTKLRFLSVSGANLIGDFQNLLPQLRWLRWKDCSTYFAMANFHPKRLVVLDLSCSKISEDWGGWDPLKMATELKVLNLTDCQSLKTTPDLSTFTSLEILNLEDCKNLKEIHPSIGDIKTLISLNVGGCQRLKELPAGVGRMEELRELVLTHTYVQEIPISRGCLMKLETLHVKRCFQLAQLPNSIGTLKELKTLDASYCASLAYIPSSIDHLASLSVLNLGNCYELAQLPDSIGSLVSLQRLLLVSCHLLREIPDSIGKLASLTELRLAYTAIEELPESIGFLKDLKILVASYCESLACIPNSIGRLAALFHLNLSGCHKLVQLPDSIGSLVSLRYLSLEGCRSLREIPASIGKLASLIELNLNFTSIIELPESIGNMQNLRMLDISGTPVIKLLGDSGIMAELEELRATGWKNLEGLPSNTSKLVSLNKLDSDKKLSELRSRLLALVHLRRPRTPPANNSAMDYQTADSEHVLKRSRPFGISDEVNNLPVNIWPVTYNAQSHGQSSYASDDLPRNVVITLNQGSSVKSMDFHPVQQILLLVGTNMGDVMVWEVGSGARIAVRNFKVWDLGTCSTALQASLASDYAASVNRVMWSPNGIFFGIAYSKHMVHIYSYHGGKDIRNHLEIEAHVGSVNDLAFSCPNKQFCVVTCGEDRSIKVWDAVTGAKQHSFEGHEAPVCSLCPHHKENIQFIFSTATDGKIKAWLYDNMGSRDYDAPGHSSTKMASSTDGTRLFLCGTNRGESYLVEWNESEAAVKHTYNGLGKRSGGVVQFDTTKNRFLAAGDEFMVKFWDMDNDNLLISTDADGGLPTSPCIRFNKEGNLLAISTRDDSIKILANVDGIRLLRTVDNRPLDASKVTPCPRVKPPTIAAFSSGNASFGESLGDSGALVAAMVGMNTESMADLKPRVADESGDKSRIRKLTEINEPSQCRSIRLPDNLTAIRVSRLIYTNSGRDILALTSNGVHKLWKWQKSDRNSTGRATTSVVPQLWRPPGGNLMTNDTSDTNPEEAVPCLALTKNNYYVISASGGKISVFNVMKFKTLATFMPPSPASTFLAIPPQDNNIITIRMEDSSIQIYSGQVDEVRTKLKGHQRIIKGFAFSTFLNVLVSSGADSQMMTTFMPPPAAATFLAFHPQDNNIIAIGMEDSSIQIYNAKVDKVKTNLKGHQKRITGLTFSEVLNVLVSSSADSQLCAWSTEGWEAWEKSAGKFQQMPTGRGTTPLAITRVQFHVDQIHLLVVHETQIATYEAPKLKCLKQWATREASSTITDATYSCNGQSIYVSFEDGSIGVLTASTLRLRCRVNSTAYIPPDPSSRAYPLVIAAHPFEPSQFALGLTDGSVYVLEPLEYEGKWGTPPVENGVGPSMTSGATCLDQPPWPTASEAGLAQIWARRLRPRLLQPSRPPPCNLGTVTENKKRKKRRC